MLKNILKLKNVQKIEKNKQRSIHGGGKLWCTYGDIACCGSPSEGKCGIGQDAGGTLRPDGRCECI